MKRLLVGFGDSWTFGSELDIPREDPWVKHIADMLNADYVNMGTPASSIGHLSKQLFDFIKENPTFEKRKTIFMVGLSGLTRYLSYNNANNEFVNITPEAVYSTSNIHFSGQPPECIDHMRQLAQLTYRQVEDPVYNEFIAVQTITLFQQFCNYNKINCVFFSYFDMPTFNNFGHMIAQEYIYPTTITQALTGKEYAIPEVRNNEYFAGKLFHPNILGHQRIAELLKNFYDKLYPGN
jgi:lysophospholipase L1-like esterase